MNSQKPAKLKDTRRYMGVWIDKDVYEALMAKAYSEGDTLSQFVRHVLNDAVQPSV